ncbi:MAG: hypothetical protein JSR78_10665 [Proteobacteria bacterium]|nr:hypothetical protein [Pseudomonadota bacterium]
MTLRNTRRELSHVIAGRTVDGSPSDLPHLPFSKSENILSAAAVAADLMMRILSSRRKLPAEERTQVLWKLAAYVSKAGVRQESPSFFTRSALAAQFLVDKPRLITSRMGMGKIIELSLQGQRSRENRLAQERANGQELARAEPGCFIPSKYSAENAPPRPITWLSLDRNFRLEELVHPAHLVEEGVHMHHCLSWKTDDYWRSIRSGRRRIYSLRRGSEYLATFTHMDQSLTELTVRCARDDAVINALADAYRHIDRIYGPLGFALRDGNHSRLRAALAAHLDGP